MICPMLPFDEERPGRGARERGIRDVTNNDLSAMTGMLARVRDVARRLHTFTIDDVRAACTLEEQPRHPNAWSALLVNAAKAGIVAATGQFQESELPSNHRRRVQVWRSLIRRMPAQEFTDLASERPAAEVA